MKQLSARVIDQHQILPELTRSHARAILSSRIIWLSCPGIAAAAKPGQYVMVRCGEECILPRPFSIHQINDDGIALFIGICEDGKGTTWISERRAGDKIELFGPIGNGFTISPNSQNLLLVAGGIGIAPLYFLSQEALRGKCSVTLLLGASNADQLYPEHLLPSGIKLITTTASPDGQKGMVTELLPDFSSQADQVFACGPLPMYKTMAQMPELKDRSVQVSLEVRMGCGLGVCYGCTVKTRSGLKQVCHDGPVFELSDILWDELPDI